LDPDRLNDKNTYRKEFLIILEMMKDLAFNDLQFQKLFTETYSFREFHISVLESSGFMLEGRLKKHVIINNQPVDSLIHGIIKDTNEE